MWISAGDLSLTGSSTHLFRQERSERLEMWVGDRPQAEQAERPRVPTQLADHGLSKLLEQAAKAKKTEEAQERLDPELEKLLTILEKVFGMKGARTFALRMQALSHDRSSAEAGAQQTTGPQQQERAGWGVEYDLHERTVEEQSATLTADGRLTLADGSSLAFHLDWSQSSMRIEEKNLHVALGDAQLKDPLVLDIDGNGIRFSGQLATVDVDQDGRIESVARPAGADRIVALDGRVLGAQSGQAFSDLAALDGDGNGWIDSGDAVFSKLQLWDGMNFTSLAQSGVAAISTASVALPFEHRDANGGLQAVGRRGGVFLTEDGRAGAVAQVDLVA